MAYLKYHEVNVPIPIMSEKKMNDGKMLFTSAGNVNIQTLTMGGDCLHLFFSSRLLIGTCGSGKCQISATLHNAQCTSMRDGKPQSLLCCYVSSSKMFSVHGKRINQEYQHLSRALLVLR